jgi:hypothetical protein
MGDGRRNGRAERREKTVSRETVAMFHVKHICVKGGWGPENTKSAKQPHALKNQAMESMT